MGKQAFKPVDSDLGESPYIGGESFDDLDLNDEERALLDSTLGEGPAPASTEDDIDGFVTQTDTDTDSDDGGAGDTAGSAAGDEPDGGDTDGGSDTAGTVSGDGDDATGSTDTDSDGNTETRQHMVPKWRLDKVLERARRLEQQLSERQSAAAPQDDEGNVDLNEVLQSLDLQVDGAQTAKLSDAILDNKPEEANKILNDILAGALKSGLGKIVPQLKQGLTKELTNTVRTNATESAHESAFNDAVAQVYEAYPFTNPENKAEYDAAFMEDARTFQRGYMASGYSAATAVLMGTQKALQIHRPELLNEGGALDKQIAQSTKPVVKQEGNRESRQRNAQAAQQQPARTSGTGSQPNRAEETSLPNIDDLTDEEFDALPESTRARLRGDFG